jgi:hypothetical protein
LAFVAAASIFLGPTLYEKFIEIRYRFQLLEARVNSLGTSQAATIVGYQKARGDAVFAVPTTQSPFNDAGKWELVGGEGVNESWPGGEFFKTKALTVHDDDLFTGLASSDPGRAAVWRFDGQRWQEVASASLLPDWGSLSIVNALHSFEGALYAAINEQVWVSEGDEWRALRNPPLTKGSMAYALSDWEGALVVGIMNVAPRVLTFKEGRWLDMSAGLPEYAGGGVYELHKHTDGKLYAGTISNNAPGKVFRWDGDHWTQVGGRVNGSWISAGSTYPLSFASYQNTLVVTLNRNPQIFSGFVSIWAQQRNGWRPIGRRNMPQLWGESDNFNASIEYRGSLYVGSGGAPAGKAAVWELTPSGWRQVGGHGLYGSWSLDGSRLSGSRHATREYVYRLIEWRGQLVAGFGDAPGAAQVWAYTPAD